MKIVDCRIDVKEKAKSYEITDRNMNLAGSEIPVQPF